MVHGQHLWHGECEGDVEDARPGSRVDSAKETSLDPAQFERDSLLSLSLSLGGLVRDDPRVVTALEEYLEALSAGRPLSRDDFLAQHSEIADALGQCLSGLEFIHAAGVQLDGSQPIFRSSIQPS